MAREVSAAAERRTRVSSKGRTQASYAIQSVHRALAILELFSDRRPAMTAREIAELTGLNRGTAYRFCQTLLELGYLEDVGQRHYRPGLKAVSLAHAALNSRELPELAMPYLRELQHTTGETVNMALLDGPEVVYVARVPSDHLLASRLYVGSRLPTYASSLGRAMLAFLPDDEVRAILERSDLKRITTHTIVDRRRLRSELARIRELGYAMIDQEVVIGLRGVAAPVFGSSGRPVAAVNLSIPRPLEVDEIDRILASAVKQTAAAISELVARLAIDVR